MVQIDFYDGKGFGYTYLSPVVPRVGEIIFLDMDDGETDDSVSCEVIRVDHNLRIQKGKPNILRDVSIEVRILK
jgi:hypothetical protein